MKFSLALPTLIELPSLVTLSEGLSWRGWRYDQKPWSFRFLSISTCCLRNEKKKVQLHDSVSTWPWEIVCGKKWFKHNSVQKLIGQKVTSLLFTDNSRIEFRPEIDKLSWKLNSVLKDQGQEATSVPRLLFRKHSGVKFTTKRDKSSEKLSRDVKD